MASTLTHEERRALHLFGVYHCNDAGQLLQCEHVIRKIYRRRALSTHPDRAVLKGGDPESMEKAFQHVCESYNLLMDKIVLQKGALNNCSRKVKVHYQRPEKRNNPSKAVSVGFYKGFSPEKKLRFAEYLYYNQKITWEQLVSALSWQFMNRPKLGEIAKEKGWLNDSQILAILKAKKSSQRFGLVAVRTGHLSVEMCKELLTRQRCLGLPIGKYFLHEQIMTMGDLNKYLFEFRVHNHRYMKRVKDKSF